MAYAVKEMFYTLQGEGAQAGSAAVFCRFSGCNLWSGREQDRATATCQFCDTDFIGTDGDGGGKFANGAELAAAVAAKWPQNVPGRKLVVCTGGEPLLQLNREAIEALHAEGFSIAIETNGTVDVPEGVDWVCVSPKANATLKVMGGDEIKLVYPQETDPRVYSGMGFRNFFIQPMDGPEAAANRDAAVRFCMENPQWRLSLQTHKLVGIR
ncbi:MAG: 7-carboxy-7-deazaguanine synthase [Acidobacteriaceae bacterium]|nr:7-carboxy-7-deazaguanine synthase [Acidobacteriaceae bacterium]